MKTRRSTVTVASLFFLFFFIGQTGCPEGTEVDLMEGFGRIRILKR